MSCARFFGRCFSAGGGIALQNCAVTDDRGRCALEYNCVRWGSHDLQPQAGIGVYERGPDDCWPRPLPKAMNRAPFIGSIAAYTASPNPSIRSASVVNPARAGR